MYCSYFKLYGTKSTNWIWKKLSFNNQFFKWLPVSTGGFKIDNFVFLIVVLELHPSNRYAPFFAAPINEPQSFFHFFAGICKAYDYIVRKFAIPRL